MKAKKSNKQSTDNVENILSSSVIIHKDEQHMNPSLMIGEEAGAYEIIPGMTVEEITAKFFSVDSLIEPPYKIWQLNSKGHRYYYRYDENGNPEFYPSVTTILSQTLPKSPHLIKWIAEKGIDESERYKVERAAYGTFMHAAFEELLIKRSYNLDTLKGKLKDYIDYQKLPEDFIYYADDLKKDVLAFAQFVMDYDVRPLAVEIALVHPYYKYAGMIDMPCTMLDRIDGTNRINAIVDFKSGRKGFYEDAEIQLHLYREMWNVNFEKYPINRVFNFSPKDWRKTPSYNLKDQTSSPNAQKIPALLELSAIEDGKKDNIFTSVSGSIVLDERPDLTKNVISLTLSELIKTKAPNDKTSETSNKIQDVITDKEVEKKQTKKKVVKKANDTANKTNPAKKTEKRVKVSDADKEVQKEAKKAEKKKLLKDEPEI